MKRILCLILASIILFGMLSCKAEEQPQPYYFFVYNSERMTEEDLTAIDDLHELYPAYEIVMTDTIGLESAADVYRILRGERDVRGTDPSGIQIFGIPAAVPAFELRYEIETFSTPDTSEISVHDDFVSDYFYTNFNNDPESLAGISPYQLAGKLSEIDILPDFPVVRLPLSQGQFSEFFLKYREFLQLSGCGEITNISIASPIFPVGWYSVAMDDFGYFLMRARDEWRLLENLHMYGTTEGVYASSLELDGSCNAKNWAHLTNSSICEIYHDSHAGQNVLLETIFDGQSKNEYHCREILSTQTINSILDGMPYFLNTTGCEPAKGMKGNIITTALRGKCVGAFASTTLVSNVDIDCMLPIEDYDAGYTKYALMYEYLFAKSNGFARAKAFHIGQLQVAASLTDNAGIIHTHSLQTNLKNLLGIHNFGMIDP